MTTVQDQWVRKDAANMSGVVVRTYVNADQFANDAATMAAAGYFPVAQSPGRDVRNPVLLILGIVGLVLAPLGILFLLLWLRSSHPSGSLVVTYQWRAPDGR
jgi:predicted membrane protein